MLTFYEINKLKDDGMAAACFGVLEEACVQHLNVPFTFALCSSSLTKRGKKYCIVSHSCRFGGDGQLVILFGDEAHNSASFLLDGFFLSFRILPCPRSRSHCICSRDGIPQNPRVHCATTRHHRLIALTCALGTQSYPTTQQLRHHQQTTR
jgi:hypothetical protein